MAALAELDPRVLSQLSELALASRPQLTARLRELGYTKLGPRLQLENALLQHAAAQPDLGTQQEGVKDQHRWFRVRSAAAAAASSSSQRSGVWW